MQKKLETIEELKLCSEKAVTVLNETKQCLEEMKDQEIMSEEAIASIHTSTTVEEIKRALNKRPTVVFIGNMTRNSGHLSPHSICGLTTKIKMAENTSRRRSRNVLDYLELNALSSVVLYNTSKRKKT